MHEASTTSLTEYEFDGRTRTENPPRTNHLFRWQHTESPARAIVTMRGSEIKRRGRRVRAIKNGGGGNGAEHASSSRLPTVLRWTRESAAHTRTAAVDNQPFRDEHISLKVRSTLRRYLPFSPPIYVFILIARRGQHSHCSCMFIHRFLSSSHFRADIRKGNVVNFSVVLERAENQTRTLAPAKVTI